MFCSMSDNTYLPQIRALARSCRRHHPDIPFVWGMLEKPPGGFRARREDICCLPLWKLPAAELRETWTRREGLDLSVLLKPLMLGHLVRKRTHQLVYLDADSLLFD